MKIIFLICFLLLTQIQANTSELLEIPEVIKDSLPNFFVRDIHNDMDDFSKSSLKKMSDAYNKIVLVYFATWCVNCQKGLKQIKDNEAAFEKAKIKIILVNVGETESNEKVRSFLKKIGLSPYSGALDPYNQLLTRFGLLKESEQLILPKTLVLDKNLKPTLLIGKEGEDFIDIIKGE